MICVEVRAEAVPGENDVILVCWDAVTNHSIREPLHVCLMIACDCNVLILETPLHQFLFHHTLKCEDHLLHHVSTDVCHLGVACLHCFLEIGSILTEFLSNTTKATQRNSASLASDCSFGHQAELGSPLNLLKPWRLQRLADFFSSPQKTHLVFVAPVCLAKLLQS